MKKIKFIGSIQNSHKLRGVAIYAVWEGDLGGEARFSITGRLKETTRWITVCQSEFKSAKDADDAIYQTGFEVSTVPSAQDLANAAIAEGRAIELLWPVTSHAPLWPQR